MSSQVANYFQQLFKPEPHARVTWAMDYWLVGSALAIMFLGLIMVGSASVSVADRQLGTPFYYLWRQLLFTGIGVFTAAVVVRIPMRVWQGSGPALMVINLVLLVLVFIPGLGHSANGSTRWISIGSFHLQASEIVKLFSVIYLAGYLVRHNDSVRTTFAGFMRPLGLLVIIAVLLLLEPDFGAAAVLIATAVVMMWLAGVRVSQFMLLIVAVAIALALLVYTSEYRMHRLTAFLNPWADPYNSGFQLTQALIAFGRGSWLGVGLGSSVQKLFYLPEAHTDFLFAVLAEELGLVGVIVVISLFTIMIIRALRIGRAAENRERPFAGYVAYGIGTWIGLQAFINMGVNMGVLPTKGLTLPFMSYGGSSIIVMCVALALLIRVDYETRRDDRHIQRTRKAW
ncbi:MAG: putative lipid II flippase FtsW [Gammaproteobacteria bacterium]|nr:putative lipid II flippase FtsW [Gammaproteobacteria bacterium]